MLRKLLHELVKLRCRPYYLFNCDLAEGLSHFRTPVGVGLSIMESLWGHTSGFAIPTFIVDTPNGGGKVPLLPEYKVSHADGRLVLRNYQNKHFTYHDGTASPPQGPCRMCGLDHSNAVQSETARAAKVLIHFPALSHVVVTGDGG